MHRYEEEDQWGNKKIIVNVGEQSAADQQKSCRTTTINKKKNGNKQLVGSNVNPKIARMPQGSVVQ